MKRVFYHSLFAVLYVSMLSAAIPVRVIAEEERRHENTLEQVDAGAVGNSDDSVTSDIGNKSIKMILILRIKFHIRRKLRFP